MCIFNNNCWLIECLFWENRYRPWLLHSAHVQFMRLHKPWLLKRATNMERLCPDQFFYTRLTHFKRSKIVFFWFLTTNSMKVKQSNNKFRQLFMKWSKEISKMQNINWLNNNNLILFKTIWRFFKFNLIFIFPRHLLLTKMHFLCIFIFIFQYECYDVTALNSKG